MSLSATVLLNNLGGFQNQRLVFHFNMFVASKKKHTPIECGSAKLILATTISVNRVEILHLIVLSRAPYNGNMSNANKPRVV